MFELTLLDHLRLTFGDIVYRHKAHAQSAQLHARWNRWLRAGEALTMAAAAITAFGAVFGRGYGYAIAAAVLASVSLAILLVNLMFDFDASSEAHRACSARMWHIRERYRALLSDLCDGAIDVETARARRDVLLNDLHALYEHAPLSERQQYQTARKGLAAADETALTDEEIDRFMPRSLQKTGKPEAA